jgi:hypothetical protein
MADDTGIDDELDELLALRPEEFTAARNALATRLRKEGRAGDADAVKALARPPVAVWALNRLAHEERATVKAFLDAADAVRDAYAKGGDVREATAPLREAETRAAHAAEAIVRDAGGKVSDTVARGIRAALQASATDPHAADDLRRGRILREPEEPSLDALLASLPAPSARSAEPPAGGGRGAKAEREALRTEIASAEDDAAAAREEVRDTSDAVTEAKRALARAEKAAAAAAQRRDEAVERLQELRDELDRL